jgi:hypothetical protein
MNVTGFLIREAIKRWELRRDVAQNAFSDSLTKFRGEEKQSPKAISDAFQKAESAIAWLETGQARYNLKVMVDVLGERISLCEAVKRLGGAARSEKMWKSVATPKKSRYDIYGDTSTTRDPTKERAEATITQKELLDTANKMASVSGSLRAAIAKGNGTEFPHEELGLDAKLLTE